MTEAARAPNVVGMQWRMTAGRADQVLAACCVAGATLQVVLAGDQLRPNRYLAGLAMVLVCAGLAWRRRHPMAVPLATQTVMVLTSVFGHLLPGPVTVAWFSALYALAVWTSDREFIAGLLFFAVSDLAPGAVVGSFDPVAVPFTVGAVVIMLLVRLVVGGRDRLLRLAERERDVAAREAVVEERARIARELHDVIAHHVSTMVVQAGAERRVLRPEQDETRSVLSTIEQVGRGALTEMRRMVAMLREDPSDDLAPQPALDDVPLLVEQIRAAGLPVELRLSGTRRELPVGIELSAYRIVQEALTNCLKYAEGATAYVEVGYGEDSLELVVRDNGTGSGAGVDGGGHGLLGMRERVAMYGGRLEAGRRDDGGYAVRVLLPVR